MAKEPAPRVMEIVFPLKGVNRRFALITPPPYSTPDAENVRADDSMLGRARGGSRPGLSAWSSQQLGSGAAIRMLGSVTVADAFQYHEDTSFNGAGWSQDNYFDDEPTVLKKKGLEATTVDEEWGWFFKTPDIDASAEYGIALLIRPAVDGIYYGKFRIFVMLHNTTPAPGSSGVYVELTLADSDNNQTDISWAVIQDASTIASGSTNNVDTRGGWFEVIINGTTLSAYFGNTTLTASQSIGAHSGQTAIGISMEPLSGAV